ncbi:glycosyltransferase family 4 protein [Pirellulaceae bacterium]|nr:glycosyltransferase family 4 protein [Pirellulaceae bacterium]
MNTTKTNKNSSLEQRLVVESTAGTKTAKIKIAYVMSWFPKLSETFVLREMNEIETLGYQVEVFPLRKGSTNKIHAQAKKVVSRAHYTGLMSVAILLSNLLTIVQSPLRYLEILWTLIRANLGSARYFFGSLIFFPKAIHLARQMQSMKIDCIHAHFASHPAAVAYVINRISGIPYSFTAHGSDLHRDQHMLLEKTTNAACVVAISDYNRNLILDTCGTEFGEKIKVVHCGIDTNTFTPSKTRPVKPEKDRLQIICIGTLHEVKGQTYLLDACKLLKELGVDFHCKFVGGGPDAKLLAAKTKKLILESQVTFCGPCDESEVRDYLLNADVLVCPSVPTSDGRREGIPVVIMEAMGSGVPCIASDISGIPEIVEHAVNGILTPPKNAKAIANGLQTLGNDERLRLRYSNAAVRKVKQEFDLTKNVKLLANVFKSYLSVEKEV